MNIPNRDEQSKKICRGALYPRWGNQLFAPDFKGIEVCIATAYHQDPTMLRYLRDPKSDMHGDMTKQLFKLKKFDINYKEHKTLRDATKNGFVFPEFYGSYYKSCAHSLAIDWGGLTDGKWKPGQGLEMPKGNLSDHLIKKGNFVAYKLSVL